MRDKILKMYETLLEIGFMKTDEEGYILVAHGDEMRPATIDGKRMIMPTVEQMKNTNWTNRVGFHPIRESYNLGVSDLISNLRNLYVTRLNLSIQHFMREMIDLAADTDNQKNLTTEQSQVLNALTKPDDKTKAAFASLLKNSKARNDANQILNLFIRRGGEINGRTYGRTGIVSWPLYNALVASKEVNGVKLTNKDREMLISLHEFIFPLIAKENAYSVGVDNRGAPFLETLIRSTFGIASALVEAAHPYMDIIKAPVLLQFPEGMGEWLEVFDSKDMIERLRMTIPPLNNNENGEEPKEETRPVKEERREERVVETVTKAPEPEVAPRGRRTLGAPAPVSSYDTLGKAQPGQANSAKSDRAAVQAGHRTQTQAQADREQREAEARRREEEDRERRARRRAEEEERQREREEQRRRDEEYEREQRELDRKYGRDRDRGRDRDYRDRDRDRDRGGRDRDRDRGGDGDAFDRNPVLRGHYRDELDREDEDRYRRRDRYRDDRDDRRRDLRDRGGRYRDDRYDDRYDDRDRDRDYRRRR